MQTPDLKRLPAIIARARREVGADQAALARAVGISVRGMSRWETGKAYPLDHQCSDLAVALSNASGETWRALVDALRLPLDEMLAECPGQRAAAEASRAVAPAPADADATPDAAPAPRATALARVEHAPPAAAPFSATVDAQGIVDDLIRAYAEEVDVSPRRLRIVLGLLLGELQMLGLGVEEARALVLRAPRRWR